MERIGGSSGGEPSSGSSSSCPKTNTLLPLPTTREFLHRAKGLGGNPKARDVQTSVPFLLSKARMKNSQEPYIYPPFGYKILGYWEIKT